MITKKNNHKTAGDISSAVTVGGKVTKLGEEKVDLHGGAMVRSDRADPYLNMQTQIRVDDQELQKSKSFYKKE